MSPANADPAFWLGRRQRVLLMDDDEKLQRFLVWHLEQAGYQVTSANSSTHFLRLVRREHFDVILLDLMLPDADGVQLCSRLRGDGCDVPIVMMSARSDEMDRVLGLEVGADDYLAKPFGARELVARIRSLMRRAPASNSWALRKDQSHYSFGPFVLDQVKRQLSKNGQVLTLTTLDYRLLLTFIRYPRQVLSRDKLFALVWDKDYDGDRRVVDMRVFRLRKLIEDDAGAPIYIQTAWGKGYVFVPCDD